ncbi:MAG: glycosyltransferase family 39 protein [Lentisphaeria bacterium]|nr:glycosyltransferase family 39 protein [Candidatus Neomarinimicrobiota bacterium]MCF7841258.1 glycosyltransferase family 39 protein [Lentisphaeria bacterium]
MTKLGLSNRVWQILLGFTLLRLILAFITPLTPQEAYYWSWSRALDWSYFDHPPMATWLIWVTTHLFGQTIFGIKAASVLYYLGTYIIWGKLVQEIFKDDRLTCWVMLALNTTIIYELYGFVISPDSPLLMFWSLTIFLIWRVAKTGSVKYWYLAGVAMGLTWLSKYSGIFLVPSVFLFLLLSRENRRWLATPHPYLASLVAVVVFSPVLFWNASHEWVSLAFQGSRRVSSMDGWGLRFFGELIGSQMFMLTPFFFGFLIWGIVRVIPNVLKKPFSTGELLLFASGGVLLPFFVLVSFKTLVKMNWLVPAYWAWLILFLKYYLAENRSLRVLKTGLASALIFFGIGLAVILIPNVPLGDGNTWSGWKKTAARVDEILQRENDANSKAFVFSTNYKVSSLLRFYLPGQPETFAQNVFGEGALQFDYWKSPNELRGRTGILVVDDRREYRFKQDKIAPYFDSMEMIADLTFENFGQHTRRIRVFRCENYHGLAAY